MLVKEPPSINRLLADAMGADDLPLDWTPLAELGLDSLEMLQLPFDLADHGYILPDDWRDQCVTVGDLKRACDAC